MAEVLAALGPDANRPKLEQLLGLDGPDVEPNTRKALDRELDRLSAYGLLVPGTCLLEPILEQTWPAPLHLYLRLRTYVSNLSVTKLTDVLSAWGISRREAPHKAALIEAVVTVLSDRQRVRTSLAMASPELREQLVAAAFGRHFPSVYEYSFVSPSNRSSAASGHALAWALNRLLLVHSLDGRLLMPDQVALAVRGPEWHARFTPDPPDCAWIPVPESQVREAGGAAGTQAVRLVGDVLRQIAQKPLSRRKDGDLGTREIRRLAKAVNAPAEHVRLVLALADHAGLIAPTTPTDLQLTGVGRQWLETAPAAALAALIDNWLTLPDIPLYFVDLAWRPGGQTGAEHLRRIMLQVLADRPSTAPAERRSFLDTVVWSVPVMLGRRLTGPIDEASSSNPGSDDVPIDAESDALPGAVAAVDGVLAESEFLGVVAAGALSEAGQALLGGRGPDAVAASLENTLGPAQDDVVLQADLTATVLGHPSGKLTTALDQMADRESRSAATIWRFTPASIRRALDAGHTDEELLATLMAVSRSEIPQGLTYLVHDVARQHGRLRAGSAVSYLRSEDEPLLAEVAADRRLRRHDLRLLAPTVLVSTSPVAELLAALRSTGYGPIEESADGTPVLHRPGRLFGDDQSALDLAPRGRSRLVSLSPASTDPVNLAALAAQLFAESDRPRSFIDLGQTVIDVESLDDYMDELDRDDDY